jgi:hypothetical protein
MRRRINNVGNCWRENELRIKKCRPIYRQRIRQEIKKTGKSIFCF